ncbi:MAG TPA: type I methionyl aminopeptidase [Thermoanaerobaculia bacterium]|nr:type I methionyl aminopeptidase [Thermoanaerobaculia bacterium]
MDSNLKTREQMELMRQAGLIVWEAHREAAKRIEPGVTTAEINEVVDSVIARNGAIALFKGVPGAVPFPAATCISINEEIVHGIPGPRKLREGQIVSVDIGVRLDGWCADAATTHAVGAITPEAQKLLEITEGTLRLAIRNIAPKKRWAQVARVMERYVVNAGFHVIRDLAGHGIGRAMWERPSVPNYASGNTNDFKLRPGMVLAVEPMVTTGTHEIRGMPDHWTYVTADGGLAAHFEHTIAITEHGPWVLTSGPDNQAWAL